MTDADRLASHVGRLRHAQPLCEPGFAAKIPAVRTAIAGLQIADTCFYYPEDRGISESARLAKEMALAIGTDYQPRREPVLGAERKGARAALGDWQLGFPRTLLRIHVENEKLIATRYALGPRLVRGAVAFLVLAGCLCLFVPFSPVFPAGDLDSGWMLAINVAVERGLVFGKDLIFTFGPYASTYTGQYYPTTDMQMLWSAALIGSAFAVGTFLLSRGPCKASALLTIPVLGLVFGANHFAVCPDPLFFCDPLVFILLVSCGVAPVAHPAHIPITAPFRFGFALLCIALGLLPLVKGTFGLASFVAIGLGSFLLFLRRERMQAIIGLALFALSLAAFWVIAGQALRELPTFLAAQGSIVSGYTEAMSLVGPVREPIAYVAVCCLLAGLYFSSFRSAALSGLASAAGVAVLLFIAFKAGFVRHDGHALIAGGVLALTGWILSVALPGVRSYLGLFVCFAGWAAIDPTENNLSVWTLKNRIVQPFLETAEGLAARADAHGVLRANSTKASPRSASSSHCRPLRGRRTFIPLVSQPCWPTACNGRRVLCCRAIRPTRPRFSKTTPPILPGRRHLRTFCSLSSPWIIGSQRWTTP